MNQQLRRYVWMIIPSGKLSHNYGKIHRFQWVNPLFLAPFSIAMLNYQRVNVNGSRTRISVDMLHSYAGEGAWRRVDADAHQVCRRVRIKSLMHQLGARGGISWDIMSMVHIWNGWCILTKTMVSQKGLPIGILESGDYVCDVAAWLGWTNHKMVCNGHVISEDIMTYYVPLCSTVFVDHEFPG